MSDAKVRAEGALVEVDPITCTDEVQAGKLPVPAEDHAFAAGSVAVRVFAAAG